MKKTVILCGVLMLVIGGVASAAPLDGGDQTVAISASDDHTEGMVGVGAVIESGEDSSQVVYAGDDDSLYRPGIGTSNRLADAGDDTVTVVGESPEFVHNYLGNLQTSNGDSRYGAAYSVDGESIPDTTASAALNHFDSAAAVYVAPAGNETSIAAATQAATVNTETGNNSPLLLVNGTEDIAQVDSAIQQLNPSQITFGPSVGSDVRDEVVDGQTTANYSVPPDQSFPGSPTGYTLYVADTPQEVIAATQAVNGSGDGTFVYWNTSSNGAPPTTDADTVYTLGEDIEYSSFEGLVSQVAHIKNNVDQPLPAVSGTSTENETVTVTVENVGNATASGVTVEFNASSNVNATGDAVTSQTYENGTKQVQLGSVAAGDTVEFEFDASGVNTVSEAQVASYQFGSSTFEGAAIGDVPDYIVGYLSDIKSQLTGFSTTAIIAIAVVALAGIGGLIYYRRQK